MATATNYVKEEGTTFIAASQRPDGSWRKPRRVKEGFVPQEEVPLYESKGKKFSKVLDTGLPPGLTPEAWEKMKQQQKAQSKAARATGGVESETNSRPATQSRPLSTGLMAGDTTNSWTTVSSKASKKKKKNQVVNGLGQHDDDEGVISGKLNNITISSSSGGAASNSDAKKMTNTGGQPLSTDPFKRLKNLRKKLIDIEKLKQKDPTTLDKDQIDKMGRFQEVVDMIEGLEAEIELS